MQRQISQFVVSDEIASIVENNSGVKWSRANDQTNEKRSAILEEPK